MIGRPPERSSPHRTPLRERIHLKNSIRRTQTAVPAVAPFVLHLSQRDGQLIVKASSSIGQADATSPFPEVASRDLTREVMAGDTRPWKIASRAGERLFAAVFPQPIAQLFQATIEAATDKPVPVVLHIDDLQLASLPWELLRDPERERFLTLSTRTPLSRAAASAGDVPSATALERSNLRVTLLAESIEERALRVTSAIGSDDRVDVGVHDDKGLASGTERPHVLLVDATRGNEATIPRGIPLVVIAGNGSRPGVTTQGDQADLLVPVTMSDEARETFAVRLASALADGRPLDVAVASARRAVADKHSVVALDWAEPVLVGANPSRPLVTPVRSAAAAAGAEVAAKTVGWLREAISGSLSAVLFLIAGLLIYRLGFSTSTEISLDLLSPFDLFSTFKGMILALSTYQDTVLLVVAGVFLLLTGLVSVVWLWRRRQGDEPQALIVRLIEPLTNVRALSFLTIATLTIVGAYVYQQYLWRVVLPIPDGALGIAITREAAAASIREDLAGVLYNQGQTGRIVVRDLPVAFDSGDTEKARELGKRIGAQAVLIYREIDRGDTGKQYSAYIVFTDPSEGLTLGEAAGESPGDSTTSPPTDQAAVAVLGATSDDLIQTREGVELPALRTDTVAQLVSSSAGVIAYNQNRFREAITLFEQALPEDPSDPTQGMLNYYLGDALRFDNQLDAAATVLERAITFYETRQSAAVALTASDEFILVQSYFARGWIAGDRDIEGYDDAILWYSKALPLRDQLLARAGELERPFAVRGLFARIYTQLAEANRRLNRTDEQQQWEQRALDELDLLAQEAPPDDPAVLAQEAGSRFFVGDCVGANRALQNIMTIDPEAQYAPMAYGIVQYFQRRFDRAEQSWRQVLAEHPDDANARENLVNLMNFRGIGDGRFFEPYYLEQAESLWREFLEIDPANDMAHDQIADSAGLRATAILLDSTAQAQGDDLVVYKSQQLWPADPERRADAIEVLDIVIQERRIIATEIHPNQPSAEVALASAYDERQGVSIKAFPIGMGEPLDFSDPVLSQAAEAVLADAAEITEWTNRILADDSGATRVERLQAWSIAISSVSRLWTLAVLRQDYATAQSLIEERQRLFDGALVDAEAAPAATTDEAIAIYSIYSEGYLLSFFANDTDRAAEFEAKMLDVLSGQTNRQNTTFQLDATICREDRDLAAGDDALAAGNLTAAGEHYDTALVTNPEHIPALIARASLRVHQNDIPGAIADATTATTVLPTSAKAWSALVLAQLAAGDSEAVNAALAQFVQVTDGLPPQERMITIRDAISRFGTLLTSHPDHAGLVRSILPTLTGDLDAMPAEYARTYQYSQLYAELGLLALDADDAGVAESLIRRAIELDPHATESLANLAIAILVQGRDATAEIDAAITDTRDQLWQLDPQDPTGMPKQLLDVMTGQVDDYLKRFPDRALEVQPLVDAITDEHARLTG